MIVKNLSIALIATLAAIGLGAAAQSREGVPNLSGTYRCEGAGDRCQWSGATFTVEQSGNSLDVKNDKGAIGKGTVTSPLSISMGPPWNMFGVIQDGNRDIQWSNGTDWRKQ